jgi:hypothetical protein
MYWRGAYNNIGCDLLRLEVSTRWNMTYMMLKSGYWNKQKWASYLKWCNTFRQAQLNNFF